MPTQLSYRVSDHLYLVRQKSDKAAPAKPVDVPVNHIFIYDCSGSMSYDLPKIRTQLKSKLKSLLGEQDTFSAIWFSGRGECDVLLDAVPVATLADLQSVEQAIDRWLRPIGLTGFKDPLDKATKLIAKISKSNKNPFALCFMSDGCDNQWARTEILKAAEDLGARVQSATFVEYGYYADRPLLTQMAEKCGGSLIFAEDFSRYAPNFEATLQKKLTGTKRVEMDLRSDVVGGFAFALSGNELLTFAVEGGKVNVPDGLTEIAFLSPKVTGVDEGPLSAAFGVKPKYVSAETQAATYGAISLYSIRQKSDVVLQLLKATGDVAFISQFATCFGKQKYSEFTEAVSAAAFDSKKRLTQGYDPNKVPREDAFTVLDALQLLQADEANRVLFDHPKFKYSRIGRAREDASGLLTPEEQAEVDRLTDEIKATKDASKVKSLLSEIDKITSSKLPPLKFVESEEGKRQGYSIGALTFNEDRPNVSIRVVKQGTVDLSDRLPKEFKGTKVGKVPEVFSTHVFRNYAIIKDGLVNVEILPVRISEETRNKLQAEIDAGRLAAEHVSPDGDVTLINLRALPVINRKMIKSVSAKGFFERQFALCKAQSAQKVYKAYAKDKLPEEASATFSALYGEEAATWLKENGLGDNGFAPPHTTQAESKDVYLGKCLKASLKGYSKLPSLKEFQVQASKNKFNAPGLLMKPYVEEVESFLNSDFYKGADDKDSVLRAWLKDRQAQATKECRKLIFEIAQATFAIIVGQVWFSEFSSLDENSYELTVDGTKVACKVEQEEFEIKI